MATNRDAAAYGIAKLNIAGSLNGACELVPANPSPIINPNLTTAVWTMIAEPTRANVRRVEIARLIDELRYSTNRQAIMKPAITRTNKPPVPRLKTGLASSNVVIVTIRMKPTMNWVVGESRLNGRRMTPSTAFRASVNFDVKRGRVIESRWFATSAY